MQPDIEIFGLTIHTFGIMLALGFLVSGAIIFRRLRECDQPVDWAYEIGFAAFAGGLIGSRVWYLIEHWDQTREDFFGSLISGTGLVWYGGVIGGAIFVAIWGFFRRFRLLSLGDLVATPLLVGNAIGRVGCQLSGDGDYGRPSDLPWAMAYPKGVDPTTVEVHPTPIYETLTLGTAAYILWRLRDRLPTGTLFGVYLIIAGTERFFVEFVRRNADAVAGLTTAQIVSLLSICAGLCWLGGARVKDRGRSSPRY